MSGSIVISEGLVTFDEQLDITIVAACYEQLSQLLNEQKTIVLNAENIERIDGAGLQLFVAFFIAAESLSISLKWESTSEALKQSAELSGLTSRLGL